MDPNRRIVVAGGGAAGFFAAITCAEARQDAEVMLCEATAHPLAKVRVSGGGRCNVTHACFEPQELVKRYPRGFRELLGPFHRFGPRETIAWFSARGVGLKTEEDGRMFPITDRSETIAGCLEQAASDAGVKVRLRCGISGVKRTEPGLFRLTLTTGEAVDAACLLIATGGTKGSAGLGIAESLGHTVAPPVPSLFTFHIDDPLLKGLEGISVERAGAKLLGTSLKSEGALLVTHWGLSGPAILKLSAWGARPLNAANYQARVSINWADPRPMAEIESALDGHRNGHPRKQAATANPFGLPLRLWERLVHSASIAPDQTWSSVSRVQLRALATRVGASEFSVSGKSMNKEEFVTCGGVQLAEVDFATLQSRITPGLYFAGEVLDIDGITGGFNFQSAWTTGWHAGRAMANRMAEMDKGSF